MTRLRALFRRRGAMPTIIALALLLVAGGVGFKVRSGADPTTTVPEAHGVPFVLPTGVPTGYQWQTYLGGIQDGYGAYTVRTAFIGGPHTRNGGFVEICTAADVLAARSCAAPPRMVTVKRRHQGLYVEFHLEGDARPSKSFWETVDLSTHFQDWMRV